jgi:rod shape-determining protein MreB
VPIYKFVSALLSGGPYYVRLQRDRIRVRDASGSGYYDDEPLVAISDEDPPKIEAIGSEARAASSNCINPFLHPRVFLADFLVAEKVVLYAFTATSQGRSFRVSPIVVLHITEELDGGLTWIERRALIELFESAGARKVHFWEGRELSDDELRNGIYLDAV